VSQTTDILLVEDNPDDRDLTLRVLSELDQPPRVETARDGAEALDILFGRGTHAHTPAPIPRVVLLDLKLPKLTGIEVLRELKRDERTRGIPVVVLSSSQEDSDLRECWKLGVNSYVVKPVSIDAFKTAVTEIGLYWLIRNEPAR
jgi:CheY-like chemotaxis protein